MEKNWPNLAALALFATAALTAGTASAPEIKEVRFGVEASYVPFESKSPAGELQGFDIDVGNAVCAKRCMEVCKTAADAAVLLFARVANVQQIFRDIAS
jgi:ABC-type amino acid transport substrate-binding protein